MNKNDRRILARACGLEWTEPEPCPHCGYYCNNNTVFCRPPLQNPTFTTADDWELVRVKVILPNILLFESIIYDNGIQWWLQKTSHELCQTTVDIIKSRPDQFPWVVEREEERR